MIMKQAIPIGGILIVVLATISSCDVKKSDTDPSSEFSKVYDYTDMNLSFYPVDLEQTPDGGFLILSVYTDTTLSTFPLIHVMKTNAKGAREWEKWVDKSYCSAVPTLMAVGGSYYFACMDAVNQETRIMEINTVSHTVSLAEAMARQYPLYAATDNSGYILILTFDRLNRNSILTKYNSGYVQQWSSQFGIIDDVKHQIELHLEKSGMQYPFFIGQAGSPGITHYYVNCFYNYTMTMLFVNASTGAQTGILYTYQDDAAVSSAISVENNRFALSRYYSGDNYVNPSVELDLGALQGVTDFADFSLAELTPDAQVRCLTANINEEDRIVFASQTRSNQLILYFYDNSQGELKGVKFLNEKYPVTLAAMEYTDEHGLALLVQTYLIGRFPRINLIKLSPDDLKF
jgi:hypothetical protein